MAPLSDGRAAGRDADDLVAGRRPVLELLRGDARVERILIARESRPSAVLVEIRKRAAENGVPLRMVPRSEIERVARGLNHQGVVAVAGRYRYASYADLLRGEGKSLLFLDGVTDPHNLGSLLRSASGAGFGVVLPARRAAGVGASARRVAAGAAETVPVARVPNLGRAVDDARSAGLWIAGLDGGADEALWSSTLLDPPVGLVLGSEDRGISPSVRARCDAFVRIPLTGPVESLNVAIAGAIAMFEVFRRSTSSATL